MFKSKKIVSAILAVAMLGAMSTSVFADGITPFGSDTTSNLSSATNSHTLWVGPGDSCNAYGYFSSVVPSSGAVFTVQHKTEGNMMQRRMYADDQFDEYLSSNSSNQNWRGIIQWGTITISV